MEGPSLFLLGLLVAGGLVAIRELGPVGPVAGSGPPYAPGIRRPGKYFTWAELTKTRTGLENEPTPAQARNLVDLARTLDAAREYVRRPMRVTSAFRTPAVTAAVGGAENSLHTQGLAADVTVIGLSAEDLAAEFVASGASFDRLIWYPATGHLHVQVRPGSNNRTTLVAVQGGYVEKTPEVA